MKRKYKAKKKFFESPRLEIGRILIDELTYWKSANGPTDEEFFRLVERLFKVLTPSHEDKKKV
jgi:hypothetical protein